MTSVRRRNPESGYPRGEETRARIIRTAIALFGEKGFSGVSTREIASAAGVPAPSLRYYFENKEGLYQACLDDIQEIALKAADPALRHAEKLLADPAATAEAMIDAYCMILDSMADFLFDTPDSSSRALFITQQKHPSETERPTPDKSLGRRIRSCCTEIVARTGAGDLSAEEVRVRSTTINGQLLLVHLARQHLPEIIGWDEVTSDRLQTLKKIIRTQTTFILNAYRLQER
ncbi:MAG: CerR family C-terminal domain-containing protein [Rhizobiaceae bacterium]|nr:CerR family C-terminal domain-containing protein [Rhizobiaceae bacterium]